MASSIDSCRTRVSAACVALGIVLAPAATARSAEQAAPRYSIVELPATPTKLNNNGQIAGWMFVGGDAHAAIYRDGAWVDFGVLPGDWVSAFYAINDAGSAVGFSFGQLQPPVYPDTVVDNRWRAAWAPAGATAIELLSQPPADSFAYGINESGAIVGCRNRYDDVYPDAHRAFMFANGVLTDIHALLSTPGGDFDYTCARDVNDDGIVVGEAQLQNSPPRGYFYRNGAAALLGQATYPSTGPYLTSARAINNQGKIVGEGQLAGFQADQALAYDVATGAFTSLGVEATGAYNSRANDVNVAGDAVGMMFLAVGERAFLSWRDRVVDLNDQIPPGTDWLLAEAHSINDAGQIVGRGYHVTDSGWVEAHFLLDPNNVAPSVSLPAQLAVNEGQSVALAATVSDEKPQSLTYAWSSTGAGSISDENGETATYAADSADGAPGAAASVRLTVTDHEGLTATAETVVTIANVAPSATFSASPGSVYAGQVVTLALTGATDPSAADTAAGFEYAFACSASETMGALAPASSRSCSYAAPGPQVVRGRIADKDGGLNDYSVTVTVLSHQDGVAGLIQLVQTLQASGALAGGNASSLTAKLQGAIAQLNLGNVGPAVNKLEAFINEVEAFIRTGKLSPAQGQPLVDGARQIVDALI